MAAHDAPVLLNGESGTGKELAARGLHDCGPTARRALRGGQLRRASPPRLFESELFGHEKGAFTGASRQRQDGAFQPRRHGGTLFLDEVGELEEAAQAKLLRALESGEVRRVGATRSEYPDVRVISATNRDLPAMVDAGTFRQDLYFRLAVLTVRIPALRERPNDIPLLARTLLVRNHPEAHLDDPTARALMGYEWPGNVRELRNVLTRAVVLGGPRLTPRSLSFNPWAFDPPDAQQSGEQAEKQLIVEALREWGGNRTKAAAALGMARSSLLYKMKKLGIMVPR